MRRGEIWWARLDHPRNVRPVLLLSRDGAYRVRSYVTVAPLTRSGRDIAAHVAVGPAEGLATDSVLNLDDIVTVPVAALDRRITLLSSGKMLEVARAVKFALDLP